MGLAQARPNNRIFIIIGESEVRCPVRGVTMARRALTLRILGSSLYTSACYNDVST